VERGDAAPVEVLVDQELQHRRLGHAGREHDAALPFAVKGLADPLRPATAASYGELFLGAQRRTSMPDLYRLRAADEYNQGDEESLLYDKLPGGKVKCNVCASAASSPRATAAPAARA
jgi:hypothetical protein